MAEIVNLRRARKQQARQTKEKTAEANRIQHGVAKPARDLAKARVEKERQEIEGHRLDENEEK